MKFVKAAIKNIFYAALFYSGLVYLYLRLAFSAKKNLPVVVLLYHRVVRNYGEEINAAQSINHPAKQFEREMRFVRRWFLVVSLERAVEMIRNKEKPFRPTVAITFDDGFDDNYRIAFPILKSLHLPATIFLTAGLVGSGNLPWVDEIDQALALTENKLLKLDPYFIDDTVSLLTFAEKRKAFALLVPKLKQLDHEKRSRIVEDILGKLGTPTQKKRRMLHWEEIKEMSGHNIDFGAHTMTHPILSRMPLEDAKKEIIDSKRVIEENVGEPTKHFAFPNGRLDDFNEPLKAYCKTIGFESVCSAVYGSNCTENADVFNLKRITPGKNFHIFAIDLIRAFYR